MTANEKTKKYTVIGAICFAAVAIYRIIILVMDGGTTPPDFTSVLLLAIYAMFAVALFIKNRQMVVGTAGVYAVLLLYLILTLSPLYLSALLACIVLIVVVILTLKQNVAVTKIWLIPGILFLVNDIFQWAYFEYFSFLEYTWKVILLDLLNFVGFVMIGLWNKEDLVLSDSISADDHVKLNAQNIEVSPPTVNVVESADKLKMYKDLLDSGVIVQEEFDAKKKQFLGL